MSASSAPPPGPPGLPVLGNLPEIARDPLAFYTRCARRYGDIVRYRVPRVTAYLLNHPEFIEFVLLTGRHNFVKGRAIKSAGPVLGNGLFILEGDAWRRERRLVQPAFHRERVARESANMVRLAEDRFANWHEGAVLDMHGQMNELAETIATQSLLGTAPGVDDGAVTEAFRACQIEFQAGLRTGLLIPPGLPTPGHRRLRRAVARLDQIVYRLIGERRAQPATGDDVLAILLRARGANGARLSDRQLRDDVLNIYLAGHDPPGAGLAFACYLLARHPDVQDRLHAEVHAVLAGRSPSAADLPHLRFTEMVMRETLRLYPPAWAIGRVAVQDCEIGGYRVHAGESVTLSQWVMHRDPRYYDRPEHFDPERWLPERMQGLPRFAYFPFGGGPRLCLGDTFAMQELCLVVATLVARYQLRPAGSGPLELLPAITLHPKHAVPVCLVPRSQP